MPGSKVRKASSRVLEPPLNKRPHCVDTSPPFEAALMNNQFFSEPSPLRREPLALRPKDAAEALGISERLLLDWTHEYGVPHVRLGRVLLYPVEDLREWLRLRARVEHQSFGLASCENSSDNTRSDSVAVAEDPVTATST